MPQKSDLASDAQKSDLASDAPEVGGRLRCPVRSTVLPCYPFSMRIGLGEDAHRLEVGRELWIGGLLIESPRGAVAHSDGDVLLHALSDALLSAFALGDIGMLFPDHDPKWKGLESRVILDLVLGKVRENGYYIRQVSSVITLDRPKLGPHRSTLQQHLAELVGLPKDRIGLTFKTSEGLAPDHIQARVMVYLEEM